MGCATAHTLKKHLEHILLQLTMHSYDKSIIEAGHTAQYGISLEYLTFGVHLEHRLTHHN